MDILQILKNELEKIIDNIDAGNSNISESDCLALIDSIKELSESKISKYQAIKYLNCSIPTFDRLIKEGKLPEGKRQIGFKEKFWYKSDIDKYLKEKC